MFINGSSSSSKSEYQKIRNKRSIKKYYWKEIRFNIMKLYGLVPIAFLRNWSTDFFDYFLTFLIENCSKTRNKLLLICWTMKSSVINAQNAPIITSPVSNGDNQTVFDAADSRYASVSCEPNKMCITLRSVFKLIPSAIYGSSALIPT